MRLLLYNIAYGTGCPDSLGESIVTAHRYFITPERHLDDIISFIGSAHADIVGLVEVDTGSFRTDFTNQAEKVASKLQHYHHCDVKYGIDSIGRHIPILRRQANAILTKKKFSPHSFHFFPIGFKKLIIKLDFNGVHIFLVHLALRKKARLKQLEYLAEMLPKNEPLILAGDFNTLSGSDELKPLMQTLSLRNANIENVPTFPSWKPRKQLDYILCSKHIRMLGLSVPSVRYSDHLPLILDFDTEPAPHTNKE